MQKRGQGLSTNAIILIILGVVVLSVLIMGFTMGWKNLAPWLPTDNVKTIASACEVACTTDAKYDYCSKPRTLKLEGEDDISGNCTYFSTIENNPYGISNCGNICSN